ncbi:MAG TPA: hypothetical protein VGI40_25460 [Pirellulaceae bacterium]|jgi:hypothetical protein
MDEQIAGQLGIGSLCVAGGIAAWLLPYKWNPFRLKRIIGQLLSPETNQMVPKIVGTILGVVGMAILIGTAVVGKFK